MAILRSRMAWLLGACSLAALAAPISAQAQEAAQAPVATAAQDADTVVVTARRRSEVLQDVPVTVTAFSEIQIESAGIDTPGDFIALTSNVNLVETQNAGNAFIVIRGITQARNSEPSVAVIVDGVQQVNPAQFNQQLVDVAQIEVLKGPQGALYGRNAIGGAIVITSKKPGDVLEGNAKFGVDNGPGFSFTGGLSGPIAQDMKFRLAGSYVDTEGYIPNTFLGEDADPYKDLAVRGQLLWEPTANFSVDVRAYGAKLETQALYFNIVADVNDTSLPVRVNNAGQNDRDLFGASVKLTYDAPIGTFTSVTSYDTLEEVLTGDAFNFLPIQESLFFQIFGFDLNQSQYLDVKAWSQEIRLASPDDGPVSWVVGAYAIGTERYISTGNMVDTGNGVFPVFRTPSTNPLNPQATFLADEQENFAWAVFGNLNYDISDKLELDLSLRYDRDKRENTTLTPAGFLPNVPGFPPGRTGEVREETFEAWQPKVTLSYKLTDDVTLFGGYAEGFRSGGFNQTGVGAVAAANGIVGVSDIFEAEVARTFELGFKSQFLDRRLTLNAAAYSTVTENSYFFVFLAANSTQNLGNVPEAEIRGFEVDGTFRVTDSFRLNYGLGYTFTEITDFPDRRFIGNEVPLASRYTLNLGAEYRVPLAETGWDLATRIDYRRTGKTWFDVENSTVRDPVNLVNLRIGAESDRFAITAFGTNVFDETYNAEFSPGGFVFKARPRVYGLEVSAKF